MALDYSALGKRISNFRNASGFTQEQFCEKLNMSRKHISQIEAATMYFPIYVFAFVIGIVSCHLWGKSQFSYVY